MQLIVLSVLYTLKLIVVILSDNDKEKEKNSYKHFAKSLGKILKENLQVAQQLI